MKSFWDKLKKPFLVLAPMENVTDTVFRQIIVKCAAPDVFFTEFTSTDSLLSAKPDDAMKRLKFTKVERPIVAQIWGNDPEKYLKSAKIISDLGFDGIDINMGCPDRHIVKKGCCSGLINNPTLAKEIVSAAKEGAKNLPVSVKTRLGYRSISTEWIETLLELNLPALTIHGRTVSEMSKVPAHWDEIKNIVEMKNNISKNTLIIGNGDVKSYNEAIEKVGQTGADGIMIGRGIFSNPWIFSKSVKPEDTLLQKKIELLIDHINLFVKTYDNKKHYEIMKKFYKMYINDFPNAGAIRAQLMALSTPEETVEFLKNIE